MDTTIPLGTVLGERWRITGVVGSGGFGQVFSAEDTSEVGLGQAAVKVLHPNTSPQERASFLGEVQKIAQLRHQNLVGYLDSGQFQVAAGPSGAAEIRPYLVAELCDGSLDGWLTQMGGLLDPDQLLVVLDDIVAGLAHLHDRGMIHRDIKPANVLHADGSWKLADFGLMRDLSATGTYHRGDLLIGTPIFMAPELFATMAATPPSDIYAVGVLAHLCAAGRPLHTGAGAALAHNITTVAPSIDPSIDPDVADIVAWTTAFDPGDRPNVHELAVLIDEIRSGVPGPHSPPTIAAPTAAPSPTPGPGPAAPQPMGLAPAPGLAPGPGFTPPAPAWAPGPGLDDRRPPGPGRSGLAVALAAVAALLLVAGGAATYLLAQAGDDPATAGGDGPLVTVAAPTDDGPVPTGTDEPTADDGDDGDDGVGGTPIAAPAVDDTGPGPVPDPEGHLVAPVCQISPEGQVEVVNRHDTHVDYRLTVTYRNDAGAVLEEASDAATAIAPGGRALLGLEPSEEGAATCELLSFEVTSTAPSTVTDIEHAELVSCDLDDFFSHWYNFTVRFTNPTDTTVDADVTVGVVDADGVRLDESFSTDLTSVRPGDVAQADDHNVFWNLEELEGTGVQPACQIVAVEVEEAR
ncbi:MAG: serine/threonine-protein kinase [Actinomycetota bacterium]